MSYLVIPYNKSSDLPQNLLIYLNDVGSMKLQNNQTPGIYDIAFYISSFPVVVLKEMPVGSLMSRQIEVIELAKQFNPTLEVFIALDGLTIVDQSESSAGGSPYTQLRDKINYIADSYNSGSKNIDGIWITSYDFPTIGFGVDPSLNPSKSGYTFRDCQLYAKAVLAQRGLNLAFSCNNYQYVTNVKYVIDFNWRSQPASYLFFDENDLLINTNIYGSNFSVSGSYVSGYASQPSFMFNMLLLNSIRMDKGNYGLRVCLCITANNATSYMSGAFFTSAVPLGQKAIGLAQAVYRLASWISSDYICTSAYSDFYLSEDVTSPLYCNTFDFDTTYGDYSSLGKIISLNNRTLAYQNNSVNSISVAGVDTSSLVFNSSTYPILVP